LDREDPAKLEGIIGHRLPIVSGVDDSRRSDRVMGCHMRLAFAVAGGLCLDIIPEAALPDRV
jgi:hypothetical protein